MRHDVNPTLDRRGFLLAASSALAAPRISRAASRQVLRFVPQVDLAMLDPVATPAIVTRNHGMMVFDTLYGLNARYEVEPQMAAGHTVSDDGLTWMITLRHGLLWHDNTPVLARDAVASIRRWWQNDQLGRTLAIFTDELSAPSDTVLRFRLKQPFPALPLALGKPSTFCAMMPERLAATPPRQQVEEVTGSGPFRFVANERVVGSRAVYERFAGYLPRQGGTASLTAGPKIAQLERVEWHTIPDASTAAGALLSGEVDWWEAPLPDLLPLFQRNKDISVTVKDKAGVMGVLRLNQLLPPFDNPAVRRALWGAVVQEDFMTAVMGDNRSLWNAPVGFFLPGSPAASDAGMAALTGPRNLVNAKAALRAAGYGGEKVVLLLPADFPALNATSQVAGDLFGKLGISLDLQAVDWGTLQQRLPVQRGTGEGGYNAYTTYSDGINTISPLTHLFLRATGRDGFFGWPSSAALEHLRNEYMASGDPAAQAEICRRIQVQAFEDVPYVPIGQWTQPIATRRTVQDIPDGFPIFWGVRIG